MLFINATEPHFNSIYSSLCIFKTFKAQTVLYTPPNKTMILSNNIVEIFTLSNPDLREQTFVVNFNCFGIRTTFINVDYLWLQLLLIALIKKDCALILCLLFVSRKSTVFPVYQLLYTNNTTVI